MPLDTTTAVQVSEFMVEKAITYIDEFLKNLAWLVDNRVVVGDGKYVYWTITGNSILSQREMEAIENAYAGRNWRKVNVRPVSTTQGYNWDVQFQADL